MPYLDIEHKHLISNSEQWVYSFVYNNANKSKNMLSIIWYGPEKVIELPVVVNNAKAYCDLL